MTSQLILANGFGAAVASDSASTLGATRKKPRTYETAEKIHPLGDPHRLAALHNDAVHLLGMPVGVLIDEWKASLGSRLQSVEGYRDSFLTWLGDNLDNWSTSVDREWNSFESLDRRLWQMARSVEEEVESVAEALRHGTALTVVRETNEMLESWEPNDSRLKDMADDILARWGAEGEEGIPSFRSRIEHWFGGLPRSAEIDQEIERFIRLTVEGGYEFPSDAFTEVTFVGYGQKEMFPSAASVRIFGAVGPHVARILLPPVLAEPNGSSYSLILPLAQRDVIDQVLTGLHTPMTRHAADMTVERLAGVHSDPEVSPQEPVPLGVPEGGVAESIRSELMVDLMKVSRDNFLDPALATVAGMPLGSLAEMAGALIAVQNLTLDIRGELPTVGGNIDVGTITLSDGFTWVNHKGRTLDPMEKL